MIDVEEVNKKLTVDDIKIVLSSFGAYPIKENEEYIIFRSICHHIDFENHKAKLYFYKDSFVFQCYSCSSSGNIYWLIQARKNLLGEQCNFPQSIQYVCDKVGIDYGSSKIEKKENPNFYNWNWTSKYKKKNIKNSRENKEYNKSVLEYFPRWYHKNFINDGISINIMEKFGVRFYP